MHLCNPRAQTFRVCASSFMGVSVLLGVQSGPYMPATAWDEIGHGNF